MVEVDGAKHPIGPAVPAWLGAIALLPMCLLFAGGALGGLLGGLPRGYDDEHEHDHGDRP